MFAQIISQEALSWVLVVFLVACGIELRILATRLLKLDSKLDRSQWTMNEILKKLDADTQKEDGPNPHKKNEPVIDVESFMRP